MNITKCKELNMKERKTDMNIDKIDKKKKKKKNRTAILRWSIKH